MLCCPLLASFPTWPTGGHSWAVRVWGRGHLQWGDNCLLRTNWLWALEVKCTLNSSYRNGPCKRGHQVRLKKRGSYHSSGDQQDALPEASLWPWNSKVLPSQPGAQKPTCTWVEGESGPFSGLSDLCRWVFFHQGESLGECYVIHLVSGRVYWTSTMC